MKASYASLPRRCHAPRGHCQSQTDASPAWARNSAAASASPRASASSARPCSAAVPGLPATAMNWVSRAWCGRAAPTTRRRSGTAAQRCRCRRRRRGRAASLTRACATCQASGRPRRRRAPRLNSPSAWRRSPSANAIEPRPDKANEAWSRKPARPRDLEEAPVGLLRLLAVAAPLGDPRLEHRRWRLKCVVADRLGVSATFRGHRGDRGDVSRACGNPRPDQTAERSIPTPLLSCRIRRAPPRRVRRPLVVAGMREGKRDGHPQQRGLGGRDTGRQRAPGLARPSRSRHRGPVPRWRGSRGTQAARSAGSTGRVLRRGRACDLEEVGAPRRRAPRVRSTSPSAAPSRHCDTGVGRVASVGRAPPRGCRAPARAASSSQPVRPAKPGPRGRRPARRSTPRAPSGQRRDPPLSPRRSSA